MQVSILAGTLARLDRDAPHYKKCKLTCMMGIGKTLVLLRLSTMPIWESLRSQCQILAPIYTQPRYLPPSKMLDADVSDSVIGEGCVIKNCKIQHSVIGLRFCISQGAVIEDTLLMGADYYETDAERRFLGAKGSVPIGIGKNSHIKRAIIDKKACIGDDVKVVMLIFSLLVRIGDDAKVAAVFRVASKFSLGSVTLATCMHKMDLQYHVASLCFM